MDVTVSGKQERSVTWFLATLDSSFLIILYIYTNTYTDFSP